MIEVSLEAHHPVTDEAEHQWIHDEAWDLLVDEERKFGMRKKDTDIKSRY